MVTLLLLACTPVDPAKTQGAPGGQDTAATDGAPSDTAPGDTAPVDTGTALTGGPCGGTDALDLEGTYTYAEYSRSDDLGHHLSALTFGETEVHIHDYVYAPYCHLVSASARLDPTDCTITTHIELDPTDCTPGAYIDVHYTLPGVPAGSWLVISNDASAILNVY